MTRLNNRIRDAIIDNAVEKAGIAEEKEQLIRRRADWAEACRVDALGGDDGAQKIESVRRRVDKALKDVPKGLIGRGNPINTDCYIFLNVAGMRVHAYFNGEFSRHSNATPRVRKITPDSHTLKADSKLSEQFAEIEKDRDLLESKESSLRANVRATVEKFGTVKRLKEAWPEVVELLPKDLSPAKKNLPAIPVKDLNSMIGLPSEG